jgi:hypothetical protein
LYPPRDAVFSVLANWHCLCSDLSVPLGGGRGWKSVMQCRLTGVLPGILLLFSAASAHAEIPGPISLNYGQYSIGFDGDNIDVHDSDFDSVDLLRGLNLKLGLYDTVDLRLEYDRYKYELRDDIELDPGHIFVSLHSKFD